MPRFNLLSKRDIQPEMLDHAPPDVARENLRDLIRLNTRFGGHSTVLHLFREARASGGFTVLDCGAASGDTARTIRAAYPGATVTSLDLNAVNLESAPQPKLIGDAFRLPFRDGAFDYAMSSLLLHHFQDEQVACLLRELNRVARRGVLTADLERHIFPYLFMRFSQPIFGWGDITVHDGLLSFRAAYRREELNRVAHAAGLKNVVVRRRRPAFRLTLVALK